MLSACSTITRTRASNRAARREPALPAPKKRTQMNAKSFYPVLWTLAFLLSAYGTYRLVRSLLEVESVNPTRDRIRALIGEADQLLKTLDEQRRG
jgi:hypothetical protein